MRETSVPDLGWYSHQDIKEVSLFAREKIFIYNDEIPKPTYSLHERPGKGLFAACPLGPVGKGASARFHHDRTVPHRLHRRRKPAKQADYEKTHDSSSPPVINNGVPACLHFLFFGSIIVDKVIIMYN
jgi:hypothetical protein